MSYYTDRDVKGSGTGGQFNPQAPKSREALDWIISQVPGTRIKRDDMPFSHHIADGALHEAAKMNLISEKRIRTSAGKQAKVGTGPSLPATCHPTAGMRGGRAMHSYEYNLPDHKIEYGVILPTDPAIVEVDPQAQRSLNERRAQGIADNLQLSAIGTMTVSRRDDGRHKLVDGQHRRRALRLKDIPTMVCEVHYGLSQRDEAVLFLIKNRESSRPSALDEYKIGLTGLVQQFVDTEAVLAGHNLQVSRNTSPNRVGSVAAVVHITERWGPDALEFALNVAEIAWGRTEHTWDGNLLGGLGLFYGRHPDLRGRAEELGTKLGKKGAAYRWVGRVIARASGLDDEGHTHDTGSGGRMNAAYKLFAACWDTGRTSGRIIPRAK